MFTKIRKAKGTVQLAVVGLFSLTAGSAFAGESCATPAIDAAFMGQLVVSAPTIRIADAGSMVVEARRRARDSAARKHDSDGAAPLDVRRARHAQRGKQRRFAGTHPVTEGCSGTVVC